MFRERIPVEIHRPGEDSGLGCLLGFVLGCLIGGALALAAIFFAVKYAVSPVVVNVGAFIFGLFHGGAAPPKYHTMWEWFYGFLGLTVLVGAAGAIALTIALVRDGYNWSPTWRWVSILLSLTLVCGLTTLGMDKYITDPVAGAAGDLNPYTAIMRPMLYLLS